MKAKDEIVNAIKGDKTLAKHIYKHTWISGSSTTIYPITLWLTDVCIQLDTHKNLFKKCIERILAKYPNLFKDGYFCKRMDISAKTMAVALRKLNLSIRTKRCEDCKKKDSL